MGVGNGDGDEDGGDVWVGGFLAGDEGRGTRDEGGGRGNE